MDAFRESEVPPRAANVRSAAEDHPIGKQFAPVNAVRRPLNALASVIADCTITLLLVDQSETVAPAKGIPLYVTVPEALAVGGGAPGLVNPALPPLPPQPLSIPIPAKISSHCSHFIVRSSSWLCRRAPGRAWAARHAVQSCHRLTQIELNGRR